MLAVVPEGRLVIRRHQHRILLPPKTDSVARRDTIRAQPDSAQQGQGGLRVSRLEYEGWRQYSVNCARCHGQDVLPNPVAANLLISVAPGGPVDSKQKFIQVVSEGRPDRGMPAFKSLPPDQIKAIYAYVRGRAEKRIPPWTAGASLSDQRRAWLVQLEQPEIGPMVGGIEFGIGSA